MHVTQEIVNKIISRAKKSSFGLSEGLTHKKNRFDISGYEPQDLNALALLLVNAYDSKYDLVSVINAALEVIAEKGDV